MRRYMYIYVSISTCPLTDILLMIWRFGERFVNVKYYSRIVRNILEDKWRTDGHVTLLTHAVQVVRLRSVRPETVLPWSSTTKSPNAEEVVWARHVCVTHANLYITTCQKKTGYNININNHTFTLSETSTIQNTNGRTNSWNGRHAFEQQQRRSFYIELHTNTTNQKPTLITCIVHTNKVIKNTFYVCAHEACENSKCSGAAALMGSMGGLDYRQRTRADHMSISNGYWLRSV